MSADNYGIIHKHGEIWGLTQLCASSDEYGPVSSYKPYFTAPTLDEVVAFASNEYFEYGFTIHSSAQERKAPDQAIYSAINQNNVLFTWLEEVKEKLRGNPWGTVLEISSPFGMHSLAYDYGLYDHLENEVPARTETFVVIGCTLPDSVYVELDAGYDQLNGFRIYKHDL